MEINKMVVLAGIAMSLAVGAAQAAGVATSNVTIAAQVAGPPATCTLAASSLTLGAINVGSQTTGVFSPAANCSASMPYAFSFSSINGGKLVNGTCSLNYTIVSYNPYSNTYGAANYIGSTTPSLIGTGAAQTTNFGVVIPAAQPLCTLAANSAAVAVSDTIVVSVIY